MVKDAVPSNKKPSLNLTMCSDRKEFFKFKVI